MIRIRCGCNEMDAVHTYRRKTQIHVRTQVTSASNEGDTHWEHGSTSDDIMAIAEIFKRYDGKMGSMAITSLPSLLFELAQPLGFRRANGTVCYRYVGVFVC